MTDTSGMWRFDRINYQGSYFNYVSWQQEKRGYSNVQLIFYNTLSENVSPDSDQSNESIMDEDELQI